MRVRPSVARSFGVGALVLLGVWTSGTSAAAGTMRGLIIRVPKPYDAMIDAVHSVGGEVSHRYENVDAIAASVPEGRLTELMALVGPYKVTKDPMIAQPHSVERSGGRLRGPGRETAMEVEVAQPMDETMLQQTLAALPADYNFNNTSIGASALHAAGILGQGVTVAIIDTGTANSPVVPALSGRVLGGESFVPADPVASATSRANGAHGTWVGSVIASAVIYGYSNSQPFIASLKKFAPAAISGDCPEPPASGTCWVPQIGVAPLARLYALKVFDSRGGGSPESRIIAAMDRAISLRHNFNQGVPSAPVAGSGTEDSPFVYDSLNIQVVNMSLGGGTLYAGRDLEDELTLKMLAEGIVLATSSGNDGFGAMTGGSPGSGLGSITVGASSEAAHERIVADIYLAPGLGEYYRPTTHMQTADFSSRGPTADGRFDPDLVANGVWTWAQGTCQGSPTCLAGTRLAPNNFVSGTSFAAPTVAGAAALLRQAFPEAEPGAVRNAIVAGADPHALGDGSGRIDQGRGYLNVPASASKLSCGVRDFVRPSHPSPFVEVNIGKLGFEPVRFLRDSFKTRVSGLKPGQVKQFFIESDPFTDRLDVEVTRVTPSLPPDQQNRFFGDDVILKIVDAPTSFEDRNVTAFVAADSAFPFPNPQTGLVRVAVMGDWTNAGVVSADLRVKRTRKATGFPSATGVVRQGDMIPFEVQVPPGATKAVFETHFARSWAMYPTSDIDMLLVDPSGAVNLAGSTLASPERVEVASPTSGLWTVWVSAFALPAEPDFFALFASADGVRLRATQ
jgi:subtilisin family serine protease